MPGSNAVTIAGNGQRARQADGEACAASRTVALRGDGAAVQLREVMDDRQSESEASEAAGRTVIRLAEAIEDMRQEPRVDADAVVAHPDLDRVARLHDRHAHFAARAAELHGVRQEVSDYLLQPRRVADDEGGSIAEIGDERDRRGARGGLDHLDGAEHRLGDVDPLVVERHPAADDARDVEQIVDQRDCVWLARSMAAIPFSVVAASAMPLRMERCPSEDRGHRRAELVRDQGEEIVLRAVCFIGSRAGDVRARAALRAPAPASCGR